MVQKTPMSLTAKGWLLLFAVIAVTYVWWGNFRGYFTQPSDFVTTHGTITNSFFSYSGGKGPGYEHNIKYNYTFQGQTYTSSQVNFRFWGGRTEAAARGYVQRYPVGQPVTVYILKSNPGFAVLEPEDKYGTDKMLLFLGTGYFLAIVLIIAGGVAKRRTGVGVA